MGVILRNFSHTLLVLMAMFWMRMDHNIGVPISRLFHGFICYDVTCLPRNYLHTVQLRDPKYHQRALECVALTGWRHHDDLYIGVQIVIQPCVMLDFLRNVYLYDNPETQQTLIDCGD